MIEFDWKNLGKKIVSTQNETIYKNFPGSDVTAILPAGRPSGEITSYVQRKENSVIVRYYQMNDLFYVQDSDALRIVDADASDESTFSARILAKKSTLYSNLTANIKKNAGFLKEGFLETKKRSLFEMFDFAGLGAIKPLIIGVFSFLILILVITIISKLK